MTSRLGSGIFREVDKVSTEFRLQDLAIAVLGQRLEAMVALRALEAGNLVQTKLVECRGIEGRAFAHHDKGGRFFTPFRMRRPDDRAFGDIRVLEQDLLHLSWIDVAATRDDHVLDRKSTRLNSSH